MSVQGWPPPLRRMRREVEREFAVRVWADWREHGVPPVVTADEARRLVAPYGIEPPPTRDEHASPVALTSLARRVAKATPATK